MGKIKDAVQDWLEDGQAETQNDDESHENE